MSGAAPATATVLRALAPAKINLGLHVGPRRGDGRHELLSVMQSISLADEVRLELLPATATAPTASAAPIATHGPTAPVTPAAAAAPGQPDSPTATHGPAASTASAAPGMPTAPAAASRFADVLDCAGVEGPPSENLAMRALAAFRARTGWSGPPVRVTVIKRVPVAAGLGGGSGDAAAVLRLAAAAAAAAGHPPVPHATLAEIAATLGADVPAQLRPGCWLATGAGERLESVPARPGPPTLGVLVLPSAHALSTAAVYGELDRRGGLHSAAELARLAERMRDAFASGAALPPAELLRNDLQEAAIALCPEIEQTITRVRAHATDADAVMVSGSGPTVLALFAGPDGPDRARAAARSMAATPRDAAGLGPAANAGGSGAAPSAPGSSSRDSGVSAGGSAGLGPAADAGGSGAAPSSPGDSGGAAPPDPLAPIACTAVAESFAAPVRNNA